MMNFKLVNQVFDVTEGCASDMTHALNVLGDGDMGAGIVSFWEHGALTGAILTGAIVLAGRGAYMLFSSKYKQRKYHKVLYGKVDTAAVFEDWCTTGTCPFWNAATKEACPDTEDLLDVEKNDFDNSQAQQK